MPPLSRFPAQPDKDAYPPSFSLRHMVYHKGWFVISATRESVGAPDHPDNARANDRLARYLEELDLAFVPCVGRYRGVDQGVSFFVIGDEATARLLCDLFQQESVLVPDGLMDAKGKRIAVCEGHLFGADAEAEDFVTVFARGFAWSARLKFI